MASYSTLDLPIRPVRFANVCGNTFIFDNTIESQFSRAKVLTDMYGNTDEVDEGKEGGSAAATAAALCVVTLYARYEKQYISSTWN